MRYKYVILTLIVLFVFGVTFSDYMERKAISQFWQSSATSCQVGKGCSETKFRPGYEVGDTIQNITLYTPDDQKVKLYDLVKGKKHIYLNLTTDWCIDCQIEQQHLRQIMPTLSEDTIIIPIFVAFKSEKTNINQMKEYISQQQFDFPVYLDVNNSILNHFKVNGTPTNVYINDQGRIKVIAQEVSIKDLLTYTRSKEE